MPSTTSYRALHDEVLARPGAEERLAALRSETLAEIFDDGDAETAVPIRRGTDPA